jgi:RimJ/RimL family protein N-acetyltransferase
MAVTIERLRPADSDTLFAWVNDPVVIGQTSSTFRPTSRPTHDAWFARALDSAGVFGIHEDGVLVGLVQLLVDGDEAELRIRLGHGVARHPGVGLLAARETIRRGFQDLGLRRIWAQVPKHNPRALMFNRRLGFTPYDETDEVWLIDQSAA